MIPGYDRPSVNRQVPSSSLGAGAVEGPELRKRTRDLLDSRGQSPKLTAYWLSMPVCNWHAAVSLGSQRGTLVSVRRLAEIAPAVPVPVHMVGAVLQFGPVLRTLGDVAGLAEQLSLRGFFNQDVPRLGQASADGKDLGRRIDVIELQVLRGSAAHALATQQLDETITPSLLPGLVVAALICSSIFDHLRLPQPLRQLLFYVLGLAQPRHSISFVYIFDSNLLSTHQSNKHPFLACRL